MRRLWTSKIPWGQGCETTIFHVIYYWVWTSQISSKWNQHAFCGQNCRKITHSTCPLVQSEQERWAAGTCRALWDWQRRGVRIVSCETFNIMQIRGEKHQITVRMNAVASFKNISISADLHSLEFLVGSRT